MSLSCYDDSSSSDMEYNDDYPDIVLPHKHRKRFSLVEITNRDYVRKIMSFETHCTLFPSSWEVEFTISKSAIFENFTISITLKRTDSGLIPLEAHVLSFLSNFDDEICPVAYIVQGKLPNENIDSSAQQEVTENYFIDDHYRCLLKVSTGTFHYDMLLVKARLLVIGCCDPNKPDEGSLKRVKCE